jgi:hypothetical protein
VTCGRRRTNQSKEKQEEILVSKPPVTKPYPHSSLQLKSVFIVGFVRTSILVCANQRTTPEMCPWDQKVLLSDSHPPIHTGTLLVAVAGRKRFHEAEQMWHVNNAAFVR